MSPNYDNISLLALSFSYYFDGRITPHNARLYAGRTGLFGSGAQGIEAGEAVSWLTTTHLRLNFRRLAYVQQPQLRARRYGQRGRIRNQACRSSREIEWAKDGGESHFH